jgi:hypothetical protein
MSQRDSGYARVRDEDYSTPPQPVQAVAPFLRRRGISHAWDPATGTGSLAQTLHTEGFQVTATTDDFLATSTAPPGVDAIVTNPPFGAGGRLVTKFIEQALKLVPVVAMLLRIDFDSGRTRVHLFRDHPHFAEKIVLLHRIVWFEREGAPGPSENHAWFVWDRRRRGPATIAYAPQAAAMTTIDEIFHGYCDSAGRQQ